MSVLSDRDILSGIASGRIGISDYDGKSLTPNGYDLRIAEISIDGRVYGGEEGTVRIPPKTMFFVSTTERVRMPDDVCGTLWLRTTWIRKGVVASFGMVDAGFEGTLTLGSYNGSDHEVEMPIGDRYCQIVLQTMTSASEKSYAKRSGNYQGQSGITLNPIKK